MCQVLEPLEENCVEFGRHPGFLEAQIDLGQSFRNVRTVVVTAGEEDGR